MYLKTMKVYSMKRHSFQYEPDVNRFFKALGKIHNIEMIPVVNGFDYIDQAGCIKGTVRNFGPKKIYYTLCPELADEERQEEINAEIEAYHKRNKQKLFNISQYCATDDNRLEFERVKPDSSILEKIIPFPQRDNGGKYA